MANRSWILALKKATNTKTKTELMLGFLICFKLSINFLTQDGGSIIPPDDPNALDKLAIGEIMRTHFVSIEGAEDKPAGFTIDDLASEVSAMFQEVVDTGEVTVISQVKISLNGYPAYKVRYSIFDFGGEVVLYSILTGNRVFKVAYVGTADAFDKYFPTAERIIGTFEDRLFPPGSITTDQVKALNAPQDVVTSYMKQTLGTIPGSSLDYISAKLLLTSTYQEQFTDSSFVPISYCIQDGPDDVRIDSETSLGDSAASIQVSARWGADWQVVWVFQLVLENNQWRIADLICVSS